MEKFTYDKEMSAGPVAPRVTVQGSFNSSGSSTSGKSGMNDSAIVGPANTNGPHEVNFASKSENMLQKKAEFTKGDSGELMKVFSK